MRRYAAQLQKCNFTAGYIIRTGTNQKRDGFRCLALRRRPDKSAQC